MDQLKPSVHNVRYRKGSLESKDILTKFHLTYSPLYFALFKKNHNAAIKQYTTLLLLQQFQLFEYREKSTDIISR